jgi:predicted secreted Zn-dependent protease
MMLFLLASSLIALTGSVAAVPPGVEYTEQREAYPVVGSTRRELRSALRHAQASKENEVASGGSVARTVQDLGLRYELEPVAGGCRIKGLVVSLDVTIHLPEWKTESPPAKALLEDWLRMRDALERHEEGHRDIAIDSARFLYQEVSALGLQSDCQSLRREAQKVFFRAQLRHSVRDGAYEHRTRHGIAQGAVL